MLMVVVCWVLQDVGFFVPFCSFDLLTSSLTSITYCCWQAECAHSLMDLSVLLLGGHYSCVVRLIAETPRPFGTGKFKLFK